MLTLKLISEETERVIKGLEKKHFKGAKEAVEKVLELDKCRREAQQKSDKAKQESKKMAAQIGQLMKQGKKDEAEEIKAQVAVLKSQDKAMEQAMEEGRDLRRETMETLARLYGKRTIYFGGVMQRYEAVYSYLLGEYDTVYDDIPASSEVVEEFLCDAYAGMNLFESVGRDGADVFRKAVRGIVDGTIKTDTAEAEEKNGENSTQRTLHAAVNSSNNAAANGNLSGNIVSQNQSESQEGKNEKAKYENEYNYRKVMHSFRDGRHLNEMVFPNPDPKDKKPMYIAKRIRHDEKKYFGQRMSMKYTKK